MGEKTTRREFLRQAALTGVAIAGLPAVAGAAETAAPRSGKSRVVIATDRSVVTGGEIDASKLDSLLNKSITKLTDAKTPSDGWSKLFKPDDVVGIKVNCLFGKGVSTHPEVAMAVVRGLKLAGVKEENIVIWDRSSGDLTRVGYAINRDGAGVKCYGDDGDWGPAVRQGVFNGRITKMISEKVTAFVNVPILKTHGITGISCCLKNHYGSFDNPGSHHDNHCNPAMPDFNSIPVVKQKARLVVVDALRPQYEGGPGLKPDAQFDYHSLVVSRDPLAADYQGVKIIEKKRAELGIKSFDSRVIAWLQSAQERGVGTCDPSKIEVVNV